MSYRRATIAEGVTEALRLECVDSRHCVEIGREIARIWAELGPREMLARLRTIVKRG